MKRVTFIIAAFVLVLFASALTTGNKTVTEIYTDSLRSLYSRPISEWPKPTIDSGVKWAEFAAIMPDTALPRLLAQPEIMLGKALFFDPRLSGSNQISGSSCHDPDLAWGDGRTVSLGNDHLQGSRNTPSLLNTGIAHKSFFWMAVVPPSKGRPLIPLPCIMKWICNRHCYRASCRR